MDGVVDSKTVTATPSKMPFLSERAEEYVRNSEFMDKVLEVFGNQFTVNSNPQGIVSLGIAENVTSELPIHLLPAADEHTSPSCTRNLRNTSIRT